MFHRHAIAALALLSCLVTPATAQAQAILDLAQLPALSPTARDAYAREFLVGNLPRAVAISANKIIGMEWGSKTIEQAREAALNRCKKAGGRDCAIYAENLDIVWQGHAPAPRMAVPGPLLAGTGYAFVPDDRYFWHGPQAARGLYVWSHGKGSTDSRGIQPQPHVRWFNNAGFDVVRFDREQPWDGTNWAADILRNALIQLRRTGYRMIVAGGQSRGGWNSLQILDTPGLADVVIAVSPAAQGTNAGTVATRQGPELWRITRDAKSTGTRVAVVQFEDDPYSDDPDERIEKFRDVLFKRVGPGLLIDRPDGFKGHSAGNTSAFGLKFGACLLQFALDPHPPSGC